MGFTPAPTFEMEQPLPDLTFTDLGGAPVQMSSFQGQAVLFNYWNLACKPCIEEFPVFQELADEYKGQGLVVVAVHLGGPTEDVAEFVAENSYTFTILLDLQVMSTPPLPTTYVVDRDGIVRHHWVGGPLEREEILDKLEPYLNESQSP
jgi:peroxiredoxin